MGTQAIIFTYEGQHPSQETIRGMAQALLNSDTSINISTLKNHNLNEEEFAQALVAAAVKKPSKGTSIVIEGYKKPVLSKEDKDKFLGFMSAILNG